MGSTTILVGKKSLYINDMRSACYFLANVLMFIKYSISNTQYTIIECEQ